MARAVARRQGYELRMISQTRILLSGAVVAAAAVAQLHRYLPSAQAIPPAPADNTNTPQTALLGGSYFGTPSFALSPDTPAKPTPDDSSYSAPSGGVLSAINLQVVGNESGEPS